jgi:hypothetical protein
VARSVACSGRCLDCMQMDLGTRASAATFGEKTASLLRNTRPHPRTNSRRTLDPAPDQPRDVKKMRQLDAAPTEERSGSRSIMSLERKVITTSG